MTGALITIGGITLFVVIITLIDLWNRRQDRKQSPQKPQP
jgi:hypothetical protein